MSVLLNNSIMINNMNNIILYFDEMMALYDLITEYDCIYVNANDSSNSISFDVIFKECDEAFRVYTSLCRKEVSKYGHIYRPLFTLNYNILNIKLIDRLEKQVSGI